MSFEELLAQGDSVPVEGWDFSWFDGRASEQRTSWGYAMMLADPMGRASSVLDVETGGGEVFAWALDVRQESLETVFFDVAAVVYFLRKVPWTVPGFTTARCRDRLVDLHRHIEDHGPFLSHAQRFLIEAKKAT